MNLTNTYLCFDENQDGEKVDPVYVSIDEILCGGVPLDENGDELCPKEFLYEESEWGGYSII